MGNMALNIWFIMALAMLVMAKTDCSGGTISISSTGHASAPYDEATVSFTVRAFHTTSMEKARQDGAKATQRTLGILKALGVQDKNITTNNFHVQPEYTYHHRTKEPPELRGYSVSNSLSVRVQNFNMLGEIIDKAVGAAGNDLSSLNGPHFRLSRRRLVELQHKARINAVEELGKKARDMAVTAGCSLGKVVYLSDRPPAAGGGGGSSHSRPQMRMAAMAMDAEESFMGNNAPTPIMDGGVESVYDTFYGVYDLA